MKFAKIYGGLREKEKRKMLDFYWETNLLEAESSFDKTSTIFKLVKNMQDTSESLHEAVFIKILDLFKSRDLKSYF